MYYDERGTVGWSEERRGLYVLEVGKWREGGGVLAPEGWSDWFSPSALQPPPVMGTTIIIRNPDDDRVSKSK